MADYTIKQYDTLPPLTASFVGPGSVPYPIASNAVVTFVMTSRTTGEVKISRTATVVSFSAGKVKYEWQAGDTDVPGVYSFEFEIAQAGSRITFPNQGYRTLEIVKSLSTL